MSFVRRNISTSKPEAKEMAYKTYIRPIVEYASSVWSPHSDAQKYQLEMVQRRAARFVKRDYQRTSSVTNILNQLDWDTLEHRRNISRATMFYKICNDMVDVVPNPPLRQSRSARRHNQQYTQIPCAKTVYQHSFFPASIVIWNRLPQTVVSQSTLDGFKAAIGGVRSL